MPSIKFISAVFCDEVRREYDGRALIVGATPTGPAVSSREGRTLARFGLYLEVNLSNWPVLRVRFWNEERNYSPWIKDLPLPSLEEIQEQEEIEDPEDIEALALLVINEKDTKFSYAGIYSLQFEDQHGVWQTIRDYVFPERDE